MAYRINDLLRWTSSNTRKEGVVVAIVPAGKLPRDVGFPRLGEESMPRDAESYVVRGGEPGRRQTDYWPLVSLLAAAEGLTADEVTWCHRNARQIRELILSSGN